MLAQQKKRMIIRPLIFQYRFQKDIQEKTCVRQQLVFFF
ncbi:hypothetical protein B224_3059 [Aeromonas media WS]|nr:hypothetical protein B224_3059 [Aeromonas media WS]